jgi:rhamnosyltransferase
MKTTVIVRTGNSAATLRAALDGLKRQEGVSFDLLVVDSGSTDDTLAIAAEHGARIIRIAPSDYFPGKVLNMAVAATDADLLVFHNSCAATVDGLALARLLAPFERPEVVATFARQLPWPDAEPWVERDYRATFPPAGPAPAWLPCSLVLAAMRRSAWEEHSFYTAAWGSEDVEWGTWARRNGRTVLYVPEARVLHSHNYRVRELYARRFIEGEADAFIQGGRHGLPTVARRIVAAIVRDAIHYLRRRKPLAFLGVPALRVAFHWGYYRGFQWGLHRLRSGNDDSGRGQELVLRNRPSR